MIFRPFARTPVILGGFEVPKGPLLLDCLCCGERAAELAKPCEACGTVYDEKAAFAPKRVAA